MLLVESFTHILIEVRARVDLVVSRRQIFDDLGGGEYTSRLEADRSRLWRQAGVVDYCCL